MRDKLIIILSLFLIATSLIFQAAMNHMTSLLNQSIATINKQQVDLQTCSQLNIIPTPASTKPKLEDYLKKEMPNNL